MRLLLFYWSVSSIILNFYPGLPDPPSYHIIPIPQTSNPLIRQIIIHVARSKTELWILNFTDSDILRTMGSRTRLLSVIRWHHVPADHRITCAFCLENRRIHRFVQRGFVTCRVIREISFLVENGILRKVLRKPFCKYLDPEFSSNLGGTSRLLLAPSSSTKVRC